MGLSLYSAIILMQGRARGRELCNYQKKGKTHALLVRIGAVVSYFTLWTQQIGSKPSLWVNDCQSAVPSASASTFIFCRCWRSSASFSSDHKFVIYKLVLPLLLARPSQILNCSVTCFFQQLIFCSLGQIRLSPKLHSVIKEYGVDIRAKRTNYERGTFMAKSITKFFYAHIWLANRSLQGGSPYTENKISTWFLFAHD